MMRITKNILAVLLFVLTFGSIFGQNEISIRSRQDTTAVGLDAVFDIAIDPSSDIKKFNIAVLDAPTLQRIYKDKYNFSKVDSSAQTDVDFEISDFGKWKGVDNKITVNNAQKSNQIKLKIWDSGAFMILPYIIENNEESIDTIYPDNLQQYPSLLVYPTLNPNDTIRDFTPIKDIIVEKTSWKDYLLYIYIALGLLLLTLAAIFIPKFIKKKDSASYIKEEKKVIIPAHIIALEKLNKLSEEKIWKDEDRIKEYQSKLTHILREYLENRFGIKALEQTTGEIADSLSKMSISEKDNNTIKNILQIADLVKFAKAKPGEDIHKKFLDDTIDFVKRTKKEEEINKIEK